MGNSVYQTPESEIINKYERRGSPIKAVIVACLVDIMGTFVIVVIYGFVLANYMLTQGLSEEQIAQAFSEISTYSWQSLVVVGMGGLTSIYGGYLCAKIANYNEYRIVAIYALVMIIFSLLTGYKYYYLSRDKIALIEDIGFGVLNIFSIYLGAWIYVRGKNKKLAESQQVF